MTPPNAFSRPPKQEGSPGATALSASPQPSTRPTQPGRGPTERPGISTSPEPTSLPGQPSTPPPGTTLMCTR
eukprot:15048288-Heterocapsa_arctica.AAC.1